jgi:MoaA/NifB/PqqE/SkfB family radical SAM enzyme
MYESYRFRSRYQRPNTLYIETTSACNLNCVMCAAQRPAVKRSKPSGFMDYELFQRLIDEISDEHPWIESVYLHKDGEPLLHPRILEIVDYASWRHPNVTLVTNATLLDEDKSRAILKTRLRNIRFSVDGLTKSTFERVRIQRTDNEFAAMGIPVGFDAVIKNIERFLELRMATPGSMLKVGLRTTDFKATEKELQDYRQYWSRRVDFVDVAQLSSWSGEIGKETEPEGRHACMAPWASLVVSWDGKLVPCCIYVESTGEGRGNLFDVGSSSLSAALTASGRRALMVAQLEGRLAEDAPYCASCRDWRAIPLPPRGRKGVLAALRRVAEE